MNEDMTLLQRKLFTYLRSREDIVIKRSVGFRDNNIIFMLKKNEATSNPKIWSKVSSAYDLITIDDMNPNFNDESFLETLGLMDCRIDFNHN